MMLEEAMFVGKDIKEWDNKRLTDFLGTMSSKAYTSLEVFLLGLNVQRFKVKFIQEDFDLKPNNRLKLVINDITEEGKK